MIRATVLTLLLLLALPSTTSAQDNQPQSLGDVARQALAAKSSTSKSATVVTDDNLSKSKNQAAAGKLSPMSETMQTASGIVHKDDGENDAGCSGRNRASPTLSPTSRHLLRQINDLFRPDQSRWSKRWRGEVGVAGYLSKSRSGTLGTCGKLATVSVFTWAMGLT